MFRAKLSEWPPCKGLQGLYKGFMELGVGLSYHHNS